MTDIPPTAQPWRSRIVGHAEEPPEALVSNPRNWRKHPRPQLDALAGVLSEVGWVQSVVKNVRSGHLVDGHARVALALAKKEPAVPVVLVDLSPEEEATVLATLDPIGALATADRPALERLLGEVTTDDAALRGMLRGLADENGIALDQGEPAEAPEPELDRAEELRAKWGTASGQLWEIGRHRLLCGDAFSEQDHQRLSAEHEVALALTDPPYGVGVQYGAETDDSVETVRRVVAQKLPVLRRSPVVAITSGARWLWEYPAPTWVLAWVHPAGMGVGPWGFTQMHPILVYGKDPYLRRGLGSRPDTLVLAADREGVDGHPTPKPLAVWEWILERCSPSKGEGVVDPFAGAGTTLVAAERLGRIGYGMEIEPKYVAVTLERLSKMGLEPRLLDS